MQPFSLIHYDLREHCLTLSFHDCHYLLCGVDDYSRAVWIFLLRDKTETYEKLVNFRSVMKTQFVFVVQCVRSDNESEFTEGNLQTYFVENGIICETSCVLIPLNKIIMWSRKIDIC